MRGIAYLITAVTLASCTTAPPPLPTRTAQSQTEYQRLLAGRVPVAPISCLPSYNANDMRVIDESTIAFRNGAGGRVYVTHMQGPCSNLSSSGPYALVTHQYGTASLCRGDIAQVVDTLSHMTVGSCVFGDFVPYERRG